MSCGLTTGRNEPCLSYGGIKRVHLFKYVPYSVTDIEGVYGSEITSFPAATIYPFECVEAELVEEPTRDENGLMYEQTLTFDMTKQDYLTTYEIDKLTQVDLRFLVELNDGRYKIGGLFNGARIDEVRVLSGGSKGDFNGYKITITAKEEYPTSFIGIGSFTESGALLLETGDYLLLETGFKLLLE